MCKLIVNQDWCIEVCSSQYDVSLNVQGTCMYRVPHQLYSNSSAFHGEGWLRVGLELEYTVMELKKVADNMSNLHFFSWLA